MIRRAAISMAAFAVLCPPATAFTPQALLDAGANSFAEFELRSQLPGVQGAQWERDLFLLGMARERLGDYAGAQEAFGRVPPESPWFPAASAHLAKLFTAEGKLAEAATTYEALIPTLEPAAADKARLELGDVLYLAQR
ncbi:MAG: hypothetical protein KGR26_07385, partial [Cyanobacteria bacterium REEB65]|nr:hypothetical protein [Cyanobacteria bacterium REEB65]